jgi:hypothetical protein
MDLREIEWKVVDLVHLDQGRDQRRILAKTVMNLRIPSKAGKFFSS